MDEIWKYVSSPTWWLSVVIVSVFTSVLGAYFKTYLDKFFSFISVSLRQKTADSTRQRQELIDALRADRHEQILFVILNLAQRIAGVFYLAAALGIQSLKRNISEEHCFSHILLGLSILIFAAIGGLKIGGAMDEMDSLKEAKKKPANVSTREAGADPP
jgi:hypothetical protein